MRPRDRALKALNHEEIYPVPVNLFENGIYLALQADLCRHFGLAPNDLEGLMSQLGAAVRWARRSSKLEPSNRYAAALTAFMEKVHARDFPGARKALGELSKAAAKGNESVFAELFAKELGWEKYIAEEESKGRSYKSIMKDVEKYRSESDAFRKAAGGNRPGK